MRRYTVVVAGQTVNLLLNSSGGATPSRRTIFGVIVEVSNCLTVNQMQVSVSLTAPTNFYGDTNVEV